MVDEELERIKKLPQLHVFHEDIRKEVKRCLPNYRARVAELDQMDPGDLLLIYMNWRSRLIHPHPRQVNISKELFARRNQGNALFEGYKHQIEELLQMISTGEDLTDLLSNGIRKAYELEPDFLNLNEEKHLDLLLNEQGIHHLHLPGLKNRKRSPIVFVIFEPGNAFVLDIAPHDDWGTDRLASISYGNWPERHFLNMMVDGLCLADRTPVKLKDFQRVGLRNDAVWTPIKIKKGLYVMPRTGGVTANGFSASIVRKFCKIWNSLPLFEIRHARQDFREYFETRTKKKYPENAHFSFRFVDFEKEWGFGIWESQSSVCFPLPDYFDIAR